MQLGDTAEYRDAIAALIRLKDQYGAIDDLKPLFLYLVRSKASPVAESPFAWTGTTDDRDRAIVQAYQLAFDAMIRGEDEFD